MSRLTTEQAEDAAKIAELEVRRYFDDYLDKTFPRQMETIMATHNKDPEAHEGVAKRFSRMTYILMGFATAGGFGAGTALADLIRLV